VTLVERKTRFTGWALYLSIFNPSARLSRICDRDYPEAYQERVLTLTYDKWQRILLTIERGSARERPPKASSRAPPYHFLGKRAPATNKPPNRL